MNVANAMVSQTTRGAVPYMEASFHKPEYHHPVHHHDSSPVIQILVVIGFVAMLMGVIVFTTYLDRANKNKTREPARNIPMVHMRP